MARIFFLAIAFYLLYRLIFDLIVPIYKTTKHVRSQFSKMNQQANNTQQQQTTNTPPGGKPNKVGEYIEFEEVK